ncbi:YkgJ family cysteine cluster protein [Candidatus Hodarchaeum mangrovi]
MKSPYILDFSWVSKFARFSCIKGCQECCGYTYFLPDELSSLPDLILPNLMKTPMGTYQAKKNPIDANRCFFFEKSQYNSYFCSIHENKPLRCRIYPYFPLIVEKRIVITLEPSLKMKIPSKNATVCHGIGIKGISINNYIKDCIKFLKYCNTVPQLLKTMILDSEMFNRIRNDRWFIDY